MFSLNNVIAKVGKKIFSRKKNGYTCVWKIIGIKFRIKNKHKELLAKIEAIRPTSVVTPVCNLVIDGENKSRNEYLRRFKENESTLNIVYLDRLNRGNLGARSTGKALFQILENHNIKVIDNFDNDFAGIFLKYNSIDEIYNDILNQYGQSAEVTSLLDSIKAADALVINAEGSFIYSQSAAIGLRLHFALFKLAKLFGKKTFYINSEAAEDPIDGKYMKLYDDVAAHLDCLDSFVVRSPLALEYAKKNITNKVTYIPDALFYWEKYFKQGLAKPVIGDQILAFPDSTYDYGKYDFNQPYICISASSMLNLTNNYNQIIENYVLFIRRLQERFGYRVYFVETCASGRGFAEKVSSVAGIDVIPYDINLLVMMSILGGAEAFVSGRWHPSIMAALGGCFPVLTDANCHKTKALLEMLEIDIQKRIYSTFLDKETDVCDILDNIEEAFKQKDIRKKLQNKSAELGVESTYIGEFVRGAIR